MGDTDPIVSQNATRCTVKVRTVQFQPPMCSHRRMAGPQQDQFPREPKRTEAKKPTATKGTQTTAPTGDSTLVGEHTTTARFSISNPEMKVPKRETSHRIFVNRSLCLEKIKFFGFDMDYTLAVYQSPAYESLCFNEFVDRLLQMGYPKVIKELYVYDPSFPARGMWFDSKYGTMLKMDPYGNILVAMRGFHVLEFSELVALYPSKFLLYDESRIYIMNTLFTLPELYLLACLVNYFTTEPEYKYVDPTGVTCGHLFMTFKCILHDVRNAVDFVHEHGKLKELTLLRLPELVLKDSRMPLMLDRMRSHGAKTFLLTNSKFEYTDVSISFLVLNLERITQKLMGYLLDEGISHPNQDSPGATSTSGPRKWTSYFDYIVVDASKPRFFMEGNTLREVDTLANDLKIGVHIGPLRSGQVYSGGSCDTFSSLIGARGKDVLYIGDHIFGDILKSKKTRGWRTFLVVPELTQELYVWTTKRHLVEQLHILEGQLNGAYRFMDSRSTVAPDTTEIVEKIQKVTHLLDLNYGLFGSVFQSGSRKTFFANQVLRFADLYAPSCLNIIHYPFCYLFKASSMLMPHESTTIDSDFCELGVDDQRNVDLRARRSVLNGDKQMQADADHGFSPRSNITNSMSLRRPSVMAKTPTKITHNEFDDEFDKVPAERKSPIVQ